MTEATDNLLALLISGRSWAYFAFGYLMGSIPFGFLLAWKIAGRDVRDAGSGNIGATNVARVVGRKLGVLTLFLDAVKGAVPVMVVANIGNDIDVQAFTGLFAFLGHCFPIWLKFKGGKGVATGAGVLLVLTPLAAGLGILAFLTGIAVFRRVSAGSLVGALVATLAAGYLLPPQPALLAVGMMVVILLLRHRENIKRLVSRSELGV
jgi:glycerol-3-phosphate acyltransferase PlsY